MSELLGELGTRALRISPWEMLAVVLAMGYLLLAIRESLWCWYCALGSTAIYTVLFRDALLFMDSALNVYYMAMAVYGWWQWRWGGSRGKGIGIHRWPVRRHFALLVGIGVVSLVSGYLLAENTSAAWPYVDSFTTWGSVVATYMVARKILENWLYWIAINAISVFLYLDRDLNLTAILFVAYTLMAVFGYLTWRSHERQQQEAWSAA